MEKADGHEGSLHIVFFSHGENDKTFEPHTFEYVYT